MSQLHDSAESFLTQPTAILEAARALVKAGPLNVAVAFWGRGAVDALTLNRAHKGTRVLLNADSGACNPVELRALAGLLNIEVKNDPRLHAKVLIGARTMLVGSANISSNGLGFQGRELIGWREACVHSINASGIADAGLWFESIWKLGQPLDENVIKRAERAWISLRQRAWAAAPRPASGVAAPIESFDGAPLYVVLTDEEYSEEVEEDFEKRARKHALDPGMVEFYQSWGSMPKDALLFAYETDKGVARSSLDGVWDTRGAVRSIKLKDGTRAYPVHRATAAVLREYGAPTRALDWKRSVDGLIKAFATAGVRADMKKRPGVQITGSTDWCLPLYEFLQACIRYEVPFPAPWRSVQAADKR